MPDPRVGRLAGRGVELHFVATIILGSPQVDFVAWTMTAVGMKMVARESSGIPAFC